MASALIERYDDRISGVLSCYDRVVVTGTLPTVCYANGMTRFLYARQIRIFGYPEFAVTLRDKVREAAASLAAEAGVAIEHVAKSRVRKEAIVARVLARRGDHPGLVLSRRWRPATPTSHGTTSRRTRPFCFRTAASACTITSTSWTPSSAWSICGFPLGRRSACNSTATAIAGWRGDWQRKALASHWLTTPSRGSTGATCPGTG